MRTDSELLQAWADGDEAAMEAFFSRHVDAAWRLARTFFGNASDADDPVQVAFAHISQERSGASQRSEAISLLLSLSAEGPLKQRRVVNDLLKNLKKRGFIEGDLPEGPGPQSDPVDQGNAF